MEKTYKKSWIIKGILVSIKKNKTYSKFCQAKDPEKKRSLHETFKKYRNIIANLTRISKEKYYKNHFQENKSNLCKTWQGIKQIILIKQTNDRQLNGLKINNTIVNDRKENSLQQNSINSLVQ